MRCVRPISCRVGWAAGLTRVLHGCVEQPPATDPHPRPSWPLLRRRSACGGQCGGGRAGERDGRDESPAAGLAVHLRHPEGLPGGGGGGTARKKDSSARARVEGRLRAAALGRRSLARQAHPRSCVVPAPARPPACPPACPPTGQRLHARARPPPRSQVQHKRGGALPTNMLALMGLLEEEGPAFGAKSLVTVGGQLACRGRVAVPPHAAASRPRHGHAAPAAAARSRRPCCCHDRQPGWHAALTRASSPPRSGEWRTVVWCLAATRPPPHCWTPCATSSCRQGGGSAHRCRADRCGPARARLLLRARTRASPAPSPQRYPLDTTGHALASSRLASAIRPPPQHTHKRALPTTLVPCSRGRMARPRWCTALRCLTR